MEYWRCNIQLAIPLDVYNALPATKKLAARDIIRELKALAKKVNTGKPNEEMTVKASWHICQHETNPVTLCVEQDI